MNTAQISLTVPETLLTAAKEYGKELGYLNVQELILDILRHKVILDNIERYKEIEERMKKGVGVKRFDQKSAVSYLRGI